MRSWEGIWRRVLAEALTILISVASAGAAPMMDKNFLSAGCGGVEDPFRHQEWQTGS